MRYGSSAGPEEETVVEQMHPKRLEILKFLAKREVTKGSLAPSVREIARTVGLKSSQTVHHHLRKLEEADYLERLDDRSRTPKLTAKGWEAAGRAPLLGRVAAGRGIEAIADEGGSSLAADLFASRLGRRRYTLTATGDSMTGARIDEGDTLLVEENEDPPDGTVVVALLNGERVTVKRLYREGEMVRLKPQNGEHKDIVVSAEEVRVQGEVLIVLHPPGR